MSNEKKMTLVEQKMVPAPAKNKTTLERIDFLAALADKMLRGNKRVAGLTEEEKIAVWSLCKMQIKEYQDGSAHVCE